jgi:hypothetical protein
MRTADLENDPPSREAVEDEADHVKCSVAALLEWLRHCLDAHGDRALTREITNDVHQDICGSLRSFMASK